MVNYYPDSYHSLTLVKGYTPPGIDDAIYLTLDSELFDVQGDGALSGDFPNGIVTDDNVPTVSDITVSLRLPDCILKDDLVIARTQSSQDGTWKITGLNKSLRFNVIAKKSMRNHVIASNITPE